MPLRGVFLGRGPGSLSPLGSHIHGVPSEPQHLLLQDGLKVMGGEHCRDQWGPASPGAAGRGRPREGGVTVIPA